MASKRRLSPAADGTPRWELRVYRGRDRVTGKRRDESRVIRGTAKEADEALARLVVDLADRGSTAVQKGTVADLAQQWTGHLQAIGRAGSTGESYQAKLDNHILPAIGKRRVDQLTAMDLDRLYGAMVRNGLVRSVPGVHAVVRSMLSQAVKWDLVNRNVAKQATLPRVDYLPPWAPSDTTFLAVLEEAVERNPDLGAYLLVTADLGARRSEPLALQWPDIDWDAGEVELSYALEHTNAMRKAGEDPRRKPTKTHAAGRIAVTPDALAALRDVRERQQAFASSAGVILRADAYVWADMARDPTGGVPWRPDRVTRAVRRIRKDPKVAKLPDAASLTVKSLRHFMVSNVAAKVGIAEAMRRARHRSLNTTQRYHSLIESRKRESADAMAEVFALRQPRRDAQEAPAP